MSRSRRSLLHRCVAALSVAVAGCSGTTECDAVELPRPTPTAEGLEPLPYPDYPESPTAQTAREFVTEFERAYQHNRFLAGFPGGTDTMILNVGVPDGFVVEDGDGYLVGVSATIATEDNRRPASTGTDTPTAAPSYDDEFAAWYHLTPRRVRRKEIGHDLPGTPTDVDRSDMTTVLCV